MNTAVVTTGLIPLVISSRVTFEQKARLNGVPWDLTGGSAVLYLKDPVGNQTQIAAAIVAGVALASWTVAAPAGTWTRAWLNTDASGLVQKTRPIVFTVIDSP